MISVGLFFTVPEGLRPSVRLAIVSLLARRSLLRLGMGLKCAPSMRRHSGRRRRA